MPTAASASTRARDGNPLPGAGWDRLRDRTIAGRGLRGTSSWIPTREQTLSSAPTRRRLRSRRRLEDGGRRKGRPPSGPVDGGSLRCVGEPRRPCRRLDLRCRRVVPGWGHARCPRPTRLAARLRALPVAAECLPHCLDLALLPHSPNDTAGPGVGCLASDSQSGAAGTGQAVRSHQTAVSARPRADRLARNPHRAGAELALVVRRPESEEREAWRAVVVARGCALVGSAAWRWQGPTQSV
jgi:hypothetical protein